MIIPYFHFLPKPLPLFAPQRSPHSYLPGSHFRSHCHCSGVGGRVGTKVRRGRRRKEEEGETLYEPLLWYHGTGVVQWVKAHMGGIFSRGGSGGGPADVFALHGYLPEGEKNPVYMRCNPTRGGICFFPNRAYSLHGSS